MVLGEQGHEVSGSPSGTFGIHSNVTMSSTSAFTRSRKSFLGGIALLTFIALALRLFRLSHQSFWVDEVDSIMAAQGPLKGIYERSVLAANSLPTYFFLLRPFVGDSTTDLEVRARLLSVIAGTFSIPVFIGVVFLWRKQRATALLAGALLAINPLHLWYSQETRGYALMLLFGLLTLLCFDLARQKNRPGWWVLYILSALMAIAVHKTGLIFPVACGLWHLWDLSRNRQRLTPLLAHAPVALAAFVALLLKSYPPGEGYTRSATGLEIGYTFLTFIGGYSFGPSTTDIQSYGPLAAISKHALQTGLLLLVLLGFGLAFASRFRKLISGRESQLLFLGLIVVSLYALVSGFPYNVRYVLPALFGFLALAAVMATDTEKSLVAKFPLLGLLILSLWADGQWFYSWQYRKGDSRAVAQWLVENKSQLRSWTVLPKYMNVPIEWYLKPNPDVLAREMPPTSDRSTTFPPAPDVLIITRRHHLAQPDQVIASYQSTTSSQETLREFAGFELYTTAKPTESAPK